MCVYLCVCVCVFLCVPVCVPVCEPVQVLPDGGGPVRDRGAQQCPAGGATLREGHRPGESPQGATRETPSDWLSQELLLVGL